MGTVTLPMILAGPIVRAASERQVTIWLATSKPVCASVSISAESHTLSSRPPTSRHPRAPQALSSGSGETCQVAANLHVLVLDISANRTSTFPADTTIYYDIRLQLTNGAPAPLASWFSSDDSAPWLYGDATLPSFVIQRSAPLSILHGSCRKLHGDGDDVTREMDAMLGKQIKSANRPTHMLLTGDQIYGDDVSPKLLPAIQAIARALVGDANPEQVPPFGDVASMSTAARRSAIRACGYPRLEEAQYSHLLTFGEYAALYLLTWSPTLWPSAATFAGNTSEFQNWLRDGAAARRLMANLVTHTLCDDHEVTDDWNISLRWRRDVRANDTGRRIVANGMFANWVFQVAPTLSASERAKGFKVVRAVVSEGNDAREYEQYIWDSGPYTYQTETSPPILMLDTRTTRQFPGLDSAPILLTDDGFSDLSKRFDSTSDAFIVSPAPVLDFRAIEISKDFGASILSNTHVLLEILRRVARLPIASAKALVAMLFAPEMPAPQGAYKFDSERWSSSAPGTIKLLDALVSAGLNSATFISGDVHYGYAIAATVVASNGRQLHIRQLTSSAIRNMPETTQQLMIKWLTEPQYLTSTINFWRTPPQIQLVDELNAMKGLTPQQADCCAELIDGVGQLALDGFISNELATLLGIIDPPAYKLYARAAFDSATGTPTVIVNNFGVVQLDARSIRSNYLGYRSELHNLDVSNAPVQRRSKS